MDEPPTPMAGAISSERCVGRFAPSPTGRMHLGNIWAALLSWLSCKSKGGEWILRIEDIDPQRSRKEYVAWLEDDLAWLGLHWDRRYVQSERNAFYEDALQHLNRLGLTADIYRSRQERLATGAPHAGDKGTVSEARRPAIGLLLPDKELSFIDGHYGSQCLSLREGGDMILRRSDGAWAYQLAVVVDDACMGVTEVVRGRDLLSSVPRQLFLYNLLGRPAPSFCHIPLLCNSAGQRLCKRDRSLDMAELRRRHTPESLLGALAFRAGLLPKAEPLPAADLISVFDWSKIPSSDLILASLL